MLVINRIATTLMSHDSVICLTYAEVERGSGGNVRTGIQSSGRPASLMELGVFIISGNHHVDC